MSILYCLVCGGLLSEEDAGRWSHKAGCTRSLVDSGRQSVHHCHVCGVYISQPVAGSVRYTCGSKCRQRAYRRRKLVEDNQEAG